MIYLNTNLLVVWDDEVEILDKILKTNHIQEYSLKYIRIREIALANNLPTSIDSLLNHFETDITNQDDLALKAVSLAIDFQDCGININSYIHRIQSHMNTTKTNQTSNRMNPSFIAIDVETAQGKRWSICQIGLTIVQSGVIQKTITKLVQPPNNKYAKGNIRVHGITQEMTQAEPLFPIIWATIYPLIKNRKLVAHSSEFDMDCLKQTLTYYGIEIPEFDYDCTYMATGMRLPDACTAYSIVLENHHDAGCDAEACAKIYLKYLAGEIPDYSRVKSANKSSTYVKYEGHEQLHGDVLKPDLEHADQNSPFYGKKVVFTGILETIKRKEAAVIVQKMGADIDTGITKRTNFVITGTDPGPSKMNKIIKYNNEGSEIKILFEKDFLKLI